MKVVKEAVAGALEHSDLLVKVAPSDKGTLDIVIKSDVIKLFGKQIKNVVTDTLDKLSVSSGSIVIEDKGALDFVIRARVQAAVLRACESQELDWGKLSGVASVPAQAVQPSPRPKTVKLRRSMLFVPGANGGMLSSSFVYKPDSVMFDLEDSVALSEKDSARLMVYQVLQLPAYRDIETVVRINGVETEFWQKDLEAAIRGRVDIVRLPKTENAQEIHELETHVARIEQECGRPVGETKLMAAIESASGVVNAVAIASASPRMTAVAIAGFDYLVDMHTKRSDGWEPELFYARAAVLHAARASHIDAFDVVYGNVKDDEGFLREVMIAKGLGFNGKSLIHPKQIELLHKAYAPTDKEVDHAKKVLAAAEDAHRKGLGVVSLDGKMVDPPVIDEAEMILQMAAAA